VSKWEGDYISAQYIQTRHNISIQENGLFLSLRVDLPPGSEQAEVSDVFVGECIDRFLSFPQEMAENRSYFIEKTGPVSHGLVIVQPKAGPDLRTHNDVDYWWQKIWVCTDGRFLFMSVLERDGTGQSPQARPGLPDRF
jgi:hypothetical protein